MKNKNTLIFLIALVVMIVASATCQAQGQTHEVSNLEEYILAIVASVFGIAFHVGLKLIELGNQFPKATRKEIGATFFSEEWDSLGLSGIITAFMFFVHFCLHRFAPDIVGWHWFELTWIGVCIVMGYQGQRLLYKWLNSAADVLDKKVGNYLEK